MALASGTPSLIGNYSIQSLLGVGGMGRVYLARNPRNEQVALKVLQPELTAATLDRLRFEREFDIASRLSHPALVQVYDRHFQDDLCYYSMEYVAGVDLRRTFENAEASLEISSQALLAFIDLADCLHYLHEHNIIHRDLKCENVMVDGRRKARLLDFGLACFRRVASKAHRITAPGTVLGTPYAMAPEQILGEAADERSDLYSLGVMLYQVFCRRLPFEAADPMAVLYQILHQPLPEFQPALPSCQALADLLGELLHKEPHQRPRTAADVKRRLEDTLAQLHQRPSVSQLRPVSLDPKPIQKLVTPRFVGRRSQQSWFDDRLQQLGQQRGGWCLVEGTAGTGKSFLLSHWAAQAKAQGITALRVNPVNGSHIPYQLWTPILRWTLHGDEELPQSVLPFVPALQLLLPDIGSAPADTPASPLDDPLQRYHLYEGMARLIAHRCAQVSTLIVLDQIQDADPASLEFLHYFLETRYYSAHSPHLPLLALGATVEEQRENPALFALKRLSEQQLTGKTLALTGFELEESHEFLESLLDQSALDPDSVRYLHQETEGKPAYLLELARLGVESGAWDWLEGRWCFRRPSMSSPSTGVHASAGIRLPMRLQAAIKQRLEGLDETALEVVRMAAVLGPQMQFRHLLGLCALPDKALYEICAQLETRRLLVERNDFELASQGTADIVLESMSWSVRRGYHARAAAYLENLDTVDFWEVAQHWALAGQGERAGQAYLAAAQQALRSLAFGEADRCFEEIYQLPPAHRPLPGHELDELWSDALIGSAQPHEAARRLGPIVAQASQPLDQVRRLRKLGTAQEMAGELNEAYQANQRALELLAKGKWSGKLAAEEGNRLCERQSRVLFTLRPPGWLEEFTALVKAQLKLAISGHSKHNQGETWAQALLYGGFWSMRKLKWAGGARLSLKGALARLEALPESVSKAHLLGDTAYLLLLSGSTRKARRVAQEAVDILTRFGAISGLARSYLQVHAVCFHQGRFGEALEFAMQGLQQARRVGNRFEEALALSDAAKTQAVLGDRLRAREYLDQLEPLRSGFRTSYVDLIAELAFCYYFWAEGKWDELIDRASVMYVRCKKAGELPHHTLHFGLLALDGQLSREESVSPSTLTLGLHEELNRVTRGQRLFRPTFKRLQARLKMAQGKRAEAFETLSECSRRAELANIPWERYRCQVLLADWLKEEGLDEHHRVQAAQAWDECIKRPQ